MITISPRYSILSYPPQTILVSLNFVPYTTCMLLIYFSNHLYELLILYHDLPPPLRTRWQKQQQYAKQKKDRRERGPKWEHQNMT